MGVTIRTAGKADLDDVVALSVALFAEDAGQRDPYTDLGWPRREGREYFGGLLAGPSTRCWLAEIDGAVCGSLVGRFAFIGNSVRGRLTVSFHSGMGIK